MRHNADNADNADNTLCVSRTRSGLASIVVGLLAVTAPPAQNITAGAGSGGVRFFSESRSGADGGRANSTTFALTATLGRVAVGEASSANYAFVGGFPGTVEATTPAPWLAAATPRFITPRSQDLVWLSGARLYPDAPIVSVAGRAATVVAQSPADVAVRMPVLSEPGWHEIRLRNLGGETVIERGIGVLPLVYTEGAPASNTAFDLVFKGTKGDMVVWVLGQRSAPKFTFGAYLHGLTVDVSVGRVLDTLSIRSNTGELRLSVPPTPYPSPLFVQGLFLSNNPGYSPGSFSNLLEF